MEFLVPMLIAALLGAAYTAVFLFYSGEKKKEGCGEGSASGHGFGCARCGACGDKKDGAVSGK